MTPGRIYNRRRAAQQIDFSQMKIKGCTPSDVDGFYEIGGKFIFLEYKSPNGKFPYGQYRAITKLLLGLHFGGLPAIAILARHDAPHYQDIQGHSAKVEKYFCPATSMKWVEPPGDRKVKEFTLSWLRWCESKLRENPTLSWADAVRRL